MVIVTFLGVVGGGGWTVTGHLDGQFERLHAKLDQQSNLLRAFETANLKHGWEIASIGNRLDGMNEKNREQDGTLRDLEIGQSRLMPYSGPRPGGSYQDRINP